jgi:osmotically-inducible protein OsmY
MNILHWTTLAAAAIGLAACDSRQGDGSTVGQKVDQAVASARSATADVKQSAKQGLDEAAQASKDKTEQIAHKLNDGAITAAINADIAKDPELSALRINVDTKDGHVALYGSAPNEGAKERAQMIAKNERGVTGVDNKLAVETK